MKVGLVGAALIGTMLIAAAPQAMPPAHDHSHKDKPHKPERDKVHDQEFARQAVLKREVLPMPRVLGLVAGYQSGDVIEVELKSRGDRLFYDVDVLVPSGQVHSLLIDARSGKLIANKAKG